ncbi:MAG: dihydrofolate reductase [Gemmatimonadales bacterium]|nr:dihydrofolate reductase [Gemmatimonadales bacterium]
MKTQYFTATTLDGYIATDDHSLDWLFPLARLEDTGYPAFIAEVGALAMGSATYQWLLQHVVKPGAEDQAPWPYTQPVWVFSRRRLPAPPDAQIRFVSGDVRPVHQEMAAQAGSKNIWIVGGGDLVGQFFDVGLLDELIVQIGSVTLGSGRPLLPRRIESPALQLRSVRRVGPGMAELHYDVTSPSR